MENYKLANKIRDWAIQLGFKPYDTSSGSPDNFAWLTATTWRCQLWEVIIESVQPRIKVEQARKQILVSKLHQRKKSTKKDIKLFNDRVELWHNKNDLESEAKIKKNEVAKLEKNILSQASDLLFGICKIGELEKNLEEIEEKSLLLKLYTNREKVLVEDLKKKVVEALEVTSPEKAKLKKRMSNIIEREFINEEECNHIGKGYHECSLMNKIEKMSKSSIPEEFLWIEVLNYKKGLITRFSEFVDELQSHDKNELCEKEKEIEKSLKSLIIQLKQKIAEKSLKVIINSTDGKFLDLKIQELEQKLLKNPNCFMDSGNSSINGNISYIGFDESQSHKENRKMFENIKNHTTVIGLKSYKDFLEDERKRLEGELMRQERAFEWKSLKDCEIEVQRQKKHFDSILNDINAMKMEENETEAEIVQVQAKIEVLATELRNEIERNSRANPIDKAVEGLKFNSKNLIDLVLETPLDAFKTVENTAGRLIFECASESHCMKNYGGELKQFFGAMLIPPAIDVESIVMEIKRRILICQQLKSFISERSELNACLKEIFYQIKSLSHDSQLCEKHYKDSSGILWNISSKIEQLPYEIEFIERLLKNWSDQPYRVMIKETLGDTNFKEFEEKCKKGNE